MTKRAAAATVLLISAASWASATGTTSPTRLDRPVGTLVLGLHPPEQVAVMDVASGRLVRRRVPGGTLCHGPLMTSRDRVMWTNPRGVVEARALDLRAPARALGDVGEAMLPAGDGRFWSVRYRGHRPPPRLVDVRLVASDGRTVIRSAHTPPAGYLQGATERALVIERNMRGWEWEPRTGRLRRAPSIWLVAAQGRRSAWCPDSGVCRRVLLTGSGPRRWSDELPGRTLGMPGSFSPDARLLALPASRGIAIVDVTTGAIRLVPGATLTANAALDWSSDGKWLYFATPARRVRAYRADDGRMVTLPGRMPAPVLELAAAG